jgi:16S rRNA (guanine527-N7)-methyltransferase
LAIVLPSLRFTLLEATGKKAEFLRAAAVRLGLDKVEVLCERAEKAGHDRGKRTDAEGRATRWGGHREAYDAVVARAVGRMAVVAEVCAAFPKVGGRILLIKGAQAEEELAEAKAALHLLHLRHAGTVQTPTGRIVVLEKPRTTPKDYPRREGEPKRSPLGVPS